jgi:hypothetical protein
MKAIRLTSLIRKIHEALLTVERNTITAEITNHHRAAAAVNAVARMIDEQFDEPLTAAEVESIVMRPSRYTPT